MKDAISLKGRLTVYEAVLVGSASTGYGKKPRKWFQKGGILHSDPNIVTTLGRVRVAELITGVSDKFVDQLALGDGGAPQLDLLVPIVPVLADTVLAHELIRQSIASALVVGQTLTFVATFLTASLTPLDFIDPSNEVINEAGLFTSDNVLFARKTFPSIPFSPGDRVGVITEWELEVL